MPAMKVEGAVLPHPSRPLPELISEGLETKPDSVAIVSATDSLTWKELDEASSSLAAAYLSLGLEPGDSALPDWAWLLGFVLFGEAPLFCEPLLGFALFEFWEFGSALF